MSRVPRLTLVVLAAMLAVPAQAQFEITTRDGKASLKLGFLTQFQGEAIDAPADDGTSQSFFIRRFRLLVGGKLGDRVTFFADTDSVNVGRPDATGKKSSEVNLSLLDAFVTVRFSQAFHIDVGQILTPNSHNSEQGATTLLPIDYSPYSFLYSGPTQSKTGRDWGVQARGYLASNHFEYRFGVFDGARGEQARMPLRTVARVVYYPFDAETGFFYQGTYFGAKRILGVGASYDAQEEYRTLGADVFLDWPVGNGDAVTFQVDWLSYDGGDTFPTLVKQDTYLIEGSYYFKRAQLGPYFQIARRNVDNGVDEGTTQIGVAYWPHQHKLSLKAGLARLTRDGAPDRDQALVQLQLFMF